MAAVKRVAQILQVMDAQGVPCPGIALAVASAQGPTPEMAYVTGADGRVRIGLPPGEAVLHAFHSDGGRQTFSIQASSEPEHAHELRMKRAGQ